VEVTSQERNKNNEEIRKGMTRCGIPSSVIPTTLILEGRKDIRDLIQAKAFIKPSGSVGLFFYPSNKAQFAKARKLFFTTAKELFLSGMPLYCGTLTKIIETLRSEDYTNNAALLDNAKMVFITDFYEEGAEFPLTGSEATQMRNWVKEMFEQNKAVCFLSDTALSEIKSWWPASFISIVAEHVVEQSTL
jgi:hypothetical protein